jgi:asparagine synthase (glutamine-hydrolysing)
MLLNEFLLHDIQFGRLQMWLRMNDLNSMMYSVESRSPLLDFRLLKYLNNDELFKFHDGFNKYLLRQAIPENISKKVTWRRDKQGFRWLSSTLLKNNFENIKSSILKSKVLKFFFTTAELKELLTMNLTPSSEGLILRCYSVSLLEDIYNCEI